MRTAPAVLAAMLTLPLAVMGTRADSARMALAGVDRAGRPARAEDPAKSPELLQLVELSSGRASVRAPLWSREKETAYEPAKR